MKSAAQHLHDRLVEDLTNDIEQWAKENDGAVPDFWGELDTSSRLAKFLVGKGYFVQGNVLKVLE